LTEDGCLPELVCVTAGDDDSDSVEQMESVATNNTAGDDDSDSGTSGKGFVEKRLNDLTMPQLRHLLDERGSTATGKWKEVLVDRCFDLGVTAAEIADAKKFKGKVRGLAVAAQDSKRARIAGPDAGALAEAGALHRAGWKFSV